MIGDPVGPLDAAEPAGPPGVDEGAGDRGGRAPRSRAGLIVSAVVAVVLVSFVAVLATREPATERRATSPLVGKVAPDLGGETLDGGAFDIDDQRGRWVVVNFFATWCRPCVEEHPELVRFDEAHRAPGDATVVGVVYDRSDLGAVRDFFTRNGGEWPVLVDGRLPSVDYGVVKVPESYLVAPSGVVVQKYTGGVTQEAIERDIAALTSMASGGGAGS